MSSTQSSLPVVDSSDGPVTPGAVASKSSLGGMQYNVTAPVVTNGQQVAMQSTSDGRLKVEPIPAITSKFRVRYSTTTMAIGAAYSTIYTRSGSGLFFGFQTSFNHANVRVRLTIDSSQVFEITLADLKLFQFNDTSDLRMQLGGFWATNGNIMDFSSKYAIPYTSSVLIEVQRSDASNHVMNNYMALLTEET